jgi:hypothetical protein
VNKPRGCFAFIANSFPSLHCERRSFREGEEKAEMTDSKPPTNSEGRPNKKWYNRTRYQILLFVGGIALFVLAVGWLLEWYIEPHTSGQKKDLVQALGLLTAGVAGAVGIFFTWRG